MSADKFEIDRQTLNDLDVFPDDNNEYSVIRLFSSTSTFGGHDKLVKLFGAPLTDADEVKKRVNAIKYLSETDAGVKIDKRLCDYVEFYLNRPAKPTTVSKIKAIEKKAMFFFTGDNDFYIINKGINDTLSLLKWLTEFTESLDVNISPALLQEFALTVRDTMSGADFVFASGLFKKTTLSAIDIAKADYLFRQVGYKRLKMLLNLVYELDVFISVGRAGRSLGFTFPVINRTNNGQSLKLSGLFHPFIENPVKNDIEFNHQKNICFVTGANMAGKSTFLKSVGICVFLSQIGFPVPAAYMETSIFDGLITTINLVDNLQMGNSHFFTEVARVKHVAQKMTQSQNMLVIFDELFRGTNVKDAFDASLAIISAFSKLKKGFFIISTHIVEVANELAAIENINFRFMETRFENELPTYSYQLQHGITEERLGFWIVKNEGIVEIIEGILNNERK